MNLIQKAFYKTTQYGLFFFMIILLPAALLKVPNAMPLISQTYGNQLYVIWLTAFFLLLFSFTLFCTLDRMIPAQRVCFRILLFCLMIGIQMVIFLKTQAISTSDDYYVENEAIVAATGITDHVYSGGNSYFGIYGNNYMAVMLTMAITKLCMLFHIGAY